MQEKNSEKVEIPAIVTDQTKRCPGAGPIETPLIFTGQAKDRPGKKNPREVYIGEVKYRRYEKLAVIADKLSIPTEAQACQYLIDTAYDQLTK